MPPPPQPLPDELVEEVLLRLPPENPAGLVRAGLVCTRWCRIVSDAGFRRRFREFRRSPAMMGVLCNIYNNDPSDFGVARFIPMTAFPRKDFPGRSVLDARHGRILGEKGSVLVVWDPITDKVRKLPFPQNISVQPWTAAILCPAAAAAAAAAGACNHLDCHHGSFLVVFVCSESPDTLVYTYSSDAAAWSEPTVCVQQSYLVNSEMGSALVGNTLYFGNLMGSTALEFNLELRQALLIQLPSLSGYRWESLLTTMEDGGLGFGYKDGSKLYMWSRKDTPELHAKWERRVIELKTVFPVDVDVTKLTMVGYSVDNVFMRMGNEVYTIDLKTYKVMKKVYEGIIHSILAYMSFYTPVLRVATTSEGPSAGASTAGLT